MNRNYLFISLAAAGIFLGRLPGYASTEMALDGEWGFTFNEGLSVASPELPGPSEYDISVKMPDYVAFQVDRLRAAKWWTIAWNTNNNIMPNLSGTGFYRKEVFVPAAWSGKAVQLYVGRAYDRLHVWINRQHIRYYPYACIVPSVLDISALLKAGQTNEIVLAVDNKDRIGSQAYRFGPSLMAPLRLTVAEGAGRIESAYIHAGPTLQDVRWEVELTAPLAKHPVSKSRIRWQIRSDSNVLGQGATQVSSVTSNTVVRWDSRLAMLRPWHPNHPQLYWADLMWECDGQVVDRVSRRFGLRQWSSAGRVLKLNGTPIYLRQVYGQQAHCSHWRYPQDKAYWLRYFEMIKQEGYNAVDWLDSPMESALEAADEIGVVVQGGATSPTIFYTENTVITKMFDLWAQVAHWKRYYPSMSIYCLGGEMPYYEGLIDDVRTINQAIKAIHPDSLLLPDQSMMGIETRFLRGDDQNLTLEPFPYHAERLKAITACSDIFGNYPGGSTNFPLGGGLSYNPMDEPWQAINARFVIYQRPLITHELNQTWRGEVYPPDGRIATLRYGPQSLDYLCYSSWWPLSSRQTLTRLIHRYLDNRKLFDNAWRLNSLMTKYSFEKTRKCDNLAGFQGMNDIGRSFTTLEYGPGYESAERFRRFNDDNVLLLDFDGGQCLKRTYWAGESFDGVIMASLFGDTPIESGTVAWEVKKGTTVLDRGFVQVGAISSYCVSRVAPIKLVWPALTNNAKVNLAVRLAGDGILVENDWDFWVFNREDPPAITAACTASLLPLLQPRYGTLRALTANSQETLWVVDILNASVIRHLEAGGRTIVMGGHPLPRHTQWTRFSQGYRGHHNHATVIHDHPLWARLPNEGWGDWQFYSLLNHAAPVVFKNNRVSGGEQGGRSITDFRMPIMEKIPFDPIVEIGEIAWLSKQAALFEWRVGAGKLLVSTLSYMPDDPAGVVFMDALLDYAAGNSFQPRTEVHAGLLRRLTTVYLNPDELRFNILNFEGGQIFPQYSGAKVTPRDGLSIRPQQEVRYDFELESNQVPKSAAGRLMFAIDGLDSDRAEDPPTKIEIRLNQKLLYNGPNQCTKRKWAVWELPFAADMLRIGRNELRIRNVEASHPRWFWFILADLRILTPGTGDKEQATGGITTGKVGEWTNQTVILTLEANQWYQLNRQEWRQGSRVTIGQEGTNLMLINASPTAEKARRMEVKIDITPPVVTLVTRPVFQQVGGAYFAVPATRFTFEAQDALSGVVSVEVAIDGGEYRPYAGEFALSVGRHEIRVRCADWAGNRTSLITGGMEGGGAKDNLQIQIKE